MSARHIYGVNLRAWFIRSTGTNAFITRFSYVTAVKQANPYLL